jgi:molybdate transport system substrate-binding protein
VALGLRDPHFRNDALVDPSTATRRSLLRGAALALALVSTAALLVGSNRSAAASAATTAPAREVRAAVAANFTATMNELGRAFSAATGLEVVSSFGASGQLFAQIANGAPFDLMLSADNQFSAQLIANGLGVADSRFIYARGQLALWSSAPGYVDDEGAVLKKAAYSKLAIANAKTAPYGRAAVETLKSLALYETVQARLITGENIAQTQQFIGSGNVPLGFVALSQVLALPEDKRGSFWIVPEQLHQPLDQEAVLLTSARDNAAARAFLDYLKSPAAQAIIRKYGYQVPH